MARDAGVTSALSMANENGSHRFWLLFGVPSENGR
jgi:hypothetical protein